MTNESVLDVLRERCTGMQRPEEFMRKPGVFDLEERKTGEIEPMGFATREEYELSLTVGCRYWCNRAQHPDARRNAESILAHTLYADVLADLSAIRHAIFDGDPNAALKRLADLETRLRK